MNLLHNKFKKIGKNSYKYIVKSCITVYNLCIRRKIFKFNIFKIFSMFLRIKEVPLFMTNPSTAFVVILGIATVFVGLLGLVILCKILSLFCNISSKKSTANTTVATNSQAASPAANQVIENRQEIIAAVSAVLAEELGTDVSAIRILSFKKI